MEIKTKFNIGDKVIARTQTSEKMGVVEMIDTTTDWVVAIARTQVSYYIRFPNDEFPWLYPEVDLTLANDA